MEYISHSVEDTYQIGFKIAEQFKEKGGVIALEGDLGAGKTTFTQGFAKALGVEEKVISPTFVLIRQHQIKNTKRMLFHVDLYRLESPHDISQIGLEGTWENSDNLVLIEWADKIKQLLPLNSYVVNIQKISENERKITVEISKS